MDGLTLLDQARAAGLTLSADGERLNVRGPRRAEPLVRALLAEKYAVLGLLAQDDPEVRWRAEAMRGQLRNGGPVPLLMARPGPFPRGTCVSCGETIATRALGPAYRCAACARAAWLVFVDGPHLVTREAA
ncbi:MAG TPA: hypothetical protein VIL85_23925 [Thermomicrobiales bacterium]|jgi:hypothetical protein